MMPEASCSEVQEPHDQASKDDHQAQTVEEAVSSHCEEAYEWHSAAWLHT